MDKLTAEWTSSFTTFFSIKRKDKTKVIKGVYKYVNDDEHDDSIQHDEPGTSNWYKSFQPESAYSVRTMELLGTSSTSSDMRLSTTLYHKVLQYTRRPESIEYTAVCNALVTKYPFDFQPIRSPTSSSTNKQHQDF